ncbi:ATPase [Gracilibacillus thailandensis]|uniref:ATPase n=1 Tax=Gracilibacillus thailandensis TaxID=563735 RepID=A0A6N7R0W1_9BACI|nr:ATPase [Gracilibacillus thailandensis]MRI66761.1 ATPase [Gracilibacillus thailandensis]
MDLANINFLIIIPVIAVLIVTLIFSLIYKDKEKQDKGFTFSYFKLSYRRKMIRTLTSSPIIIIAIITIYYFSDWSIPVFITFVIFALLVFGVQLGYNYIMWKKKEQK